MIPAHRWAGVFGSRLPPVNIHENDALICEEDVINSASDSGAAKPDQCTQSRRGEAVLCARLKRAGEPSEIALGTTINVHACPSKK